jgi:exopolyphosphatase
MTVRGHHRINEAEAQRLFTDVKRDMEASDELKLRPWKDSNGEDVDFGRWKYAWTHDRADGGRKIVRPLVEKAVEHW